MVFWIILLAWLLSELLIQTDYLLDYGVDIGSIQLYSLM